MDSVELEKLRYPIGKYAKPSGFQKDLVKGEIARIASLPQRLLKLISQGREQDLEKPYRPEGWTARQVIHHLADSHMNAAIRFKLALTEDIPVIKPYEEQFWAELPDGKDAPLPLSLELLVPLHQRWVYLLERLSEEQWHRRFHHPASKKESALFEVVSLYAWHGDHHLGHVGLSLGQKPT